jgi:hypothetical protein
VGGENKIYVRRRSGDEELVLLQRLDAQSHLLVGVVRVGVARRSNANHHLLPRSAPVRRGREGEPSLAIGKASGASPVGIRGLSVTPVRQCTPDGGLCVALCSHTPAVLLSPRSLLCFSWTTIAHHIAMTDAITALVSQSPVWGRMYRRPGTDCGSRATAFAQTWVHSSTSHAARFPACQGGWASSCCPPTSPSSCTHARTHTAVLGP